jgi:Tfp pilus assembly PilM family ATPase
MQSRSLYHKIFSDLIPPPRYLEMPSVGLDISDNSVRFVELKRNGQQLSLANSVWKQFPMMLLKKDM